MSDRADVDFSVTTSAGRRVAASVRGPADAPPVALVHASGASAAAWRSAVARLSPDRRALTIDLVGYGRSDPLPPREAFRCAEDEEAVGLALDALGAPADVVGHSYGGYLAAKLALRRPIRSLVLVEPVLFGALRESGDPEAAHELSVLYDDPSFLEAASGGSEAWMERFIDYWTGAGAWSRMPDAHRRANLRVAWKVFCEVSDLSRDPAPFAAYAKLPAVTTLVGGEHTTVAARRVLDHLLHTVPDAQRATIAGAGHMSPLTHPDAFAEVLAAHLVRADAAQR